MQTLTLKKVSEIVSLGKTTIYGKMKKGEFPENVKISTRRAIWFKSDIEKWLQEKKEAKK